MKKDLKLAVIVAIIEAVLALIVGYVLWFVQKDSVEKKTVETLAGYFDSVDEKMSYDQVMKLLYEESQKKDEEITKLTNDNALLESELAVLREQASSNDANQETITSAQSFASTNEYEKALAVLKGVANKTPQMEVLIDDYQKQYEEKVVTEIDTLLLEENYDAAKELIDKALKIIPDSAVLARKKEQVINATPQLLMNILKPYEINQYWEGTTETPLEMGGKEYYDGFWLGDRWDTAYAVFNLGAKYTKLSGLVGHIDGSGKENASLLIYADGVLVDTLTIGNQDLPKEFSIDVTEVKQLKFERKARYAQTGLTELMIR